MQPLSATPAIPHQSHFWFLTPTENILLPSTQNSVLLLPYLTNYLLPCKKSYSILQKNIAALPHFWCPLQNLLLLPKKCFVTLHFFSCAPTAKKVNANHPHTNGLLLHSRLPQNNLPPVNLCCPFKFFTALKTFLSLT